MLRILAASACGIALSVAGCSHSRRYIVDAAIADGFYANPTPEYYAEHYDELLYLVNKGDRQAIRAVIQFLPTMIRQQCSCPHDGADDGDAVLAIALYEQHDSLQFIDALTKPEDRVVVLRYYCRLAPVDMAGYLEQYLEKHPDISLEE